ncbi:MAG: hypothetical protein K2R98_17790 [Gemmataceae bacterium]|nr:hypothetical protein [Gemmataceae bacterium]
MKTLSKLLEPVRKLHEDEDGLEALQVVMILAVAAVALLVIKIFWKPIKTWATNRMNDVVGDSNFAPNDKGDFKPTGDN